MVKCMRDFKVETNHIPCFAHTLHNNVTSAIEKYDVISQLKKKTDEISAKFSRSYILKTFLAEK